MVKPRGAIACALLALSLGCGRAGTEALRVGAAASLREALPPIERLYATRYPGASTRTTYAASSVLAAQIRAGAPLDVFLSADEEIVASLSEEGRVRAATPFAGNRLVVLVSAELRTPIATPEALAGPAIRRIAIPSPAVPVGRYAREWLERRGLVGALADRSVRTEHARATLAAVDDGHADAAIVYASDARLARRARQPFAIPEAEQPRIAYAAAIVAETPDPEGARRFLALLLSPEATRILGEAGFTGPPGGAASAR